MSKYSVLLITLVLVFLLAACAVEKEPTELIPATDAVEQAEENSSSSRPTLPASPEPAANTPIPDPGGIAGELMACNLVGLLPPLDPTQAAIFPAPGENDWTQGAENAEVTIIEYSDFQ